MDINMFFRKRARDSIVDNLIIKIKINISRKLVAEVWLSSVDSKGESLSKSMGNPYSIKLGNCLSQ